MEGPLQVSASVCVYTYACMCVCVCACVCACVCICMSYMHACVCMCVCVMYMWVWVYVFCGCVDVGYECVCLLPHLIIKSALCLVRCQCNVALVMSCGTPPCTASFTRTHTPCLVLASVSHPHSLPVPAIREPFTF